MKRRDFGKTLVTAATAGIASAPSALSETGENLKARKNTLMHVGGDYHSVAGGPHADITGQANLEYNLRHGVKHLTVQMRKIAPDGGWDSDELKRMKDHCDKAGVDRKAHV